MEEKIHKDHIERNSEEKIQGKPEDNFSGDSSQRTIEDNPSGDRPSKTPEDNPSGDRPRRLSEDNYYGEKVRKRYADEKSIMNSDQIIKSTEADTENIVDFMHEEIKKRPMNRKKLLQRARETMAIAVLFGVVSCVVFAILLPIINNILNSEGNNKKTVTLPETTVSEELTPEQMLEKEQQREMSEEKARIEKELEGLLDEKIIGVEQQKRISASLQQLAIESSGMIVSVSGITSDTDLFNDSYENKDTVAGLVTKKTETAIYVLVQSKSVENANKILVTFMEGAEAEAVVAGSDSATGLTVLSVPANELDADTRNGIKEAVNGSSAGAIITGAPVIAIGSPTGTFGSVIYGNVTAADIKLEILDNDIYCLTTDIYGSKGATGFLINLDGEVVGMIDMRYSDSNIPNMLCAVGISELRPIIRRMENGKGKAFLGICGTDVTEEISETNNIPVGIWVTRVEDDSPAMAAGIQKGDVIVGYGSKSIFHMAGLITKLEDTEPGQIITLHIMRRKGGEFESINVNVETQ